MDDGLIDLPYSGVKRPFDFILSEPPLEVEPSGYLTTEDPEDAVADLVICMSLYIANRRAYYINYMAGCKCLFRIFFPQVIGKLREPCPFWEEGMVNHFNINNDYWSPNYEIQRLWLFTKIHWSWLEWAWERVAVDIVDNNRWQLDDLRISYARRNA